LIKRLCAAAAMAALLLTPQTAAAAADLAVGDKVQAWNLDWYDATILAIGTGQYQGYYLVKWTKFSGQQYIKADNVRSVATGGKGPAPANSSPNAIAQSARYTCLGYSGGAGQFRWYLTINSNSYRQSKPDLPPGTLRREAGHIEFTSGPYQANNWIGLISQQGGRQRIVLRDRQAEREGPRVREYANIYCTASE
jgi:hypothetical protein